ncbi:hypothetical protein PFLU4_59520 [Pseudomonas fluorescens]|nr:hypothetical protein PFLU4_59520 [Pseudomonas fluorescens]
MKALRTAQLQDCRIPERQPRAEVKGTAAIESAIRYALDGVESVPGGEPIIGNQEAVHSNDLPPKGEVNAVRAQGRNQIT